MLKKKFRLSRKDIAEFRGAEAKKIFTSDALTVKKKENTLGYNRFAVVVGASVSKKSVKRHFLKRKVFRVVGGWPNKKADFFIILSKNARDRYRELPEILTRALKRA